MLDCYADKLIFIKAAAGCGTSTEEQDRITGFWQHAVMGQLSWEYTVFLKKGPSKRKVDRCPDTAEGEHQRASLRVAFASSRHT